MKYFIRSVKYFVYISVVLSLILLILAKLKLINGNLSEMFVNGYDSIWQIALILAVFSAIYPKMGYCSRSVSVPGSPEETGPSIRELMDEHGYKMTSSQDGKMVFVKRSPVFRLLKLYEDTVSFTPELGGYSVEGITKDVVRLASAIDFKFGTPREDA